MKRYEVYDTFNVEQKIGVVWAIDDDHAMAFAKQQFGQFSPILQCEDWQLRIAENDRPFLQ